MPSCTYTTAKITPSTTSGSDSFSNDEPFHQAEMPAGALVRIEAKISSDMPLPMPRWVISSPTHISSVAPAVRVTMISTTLRIETLISAPLPPEPPRAPEPFENR